jgi:transcriptional regulator with XRE-family HTH domain
VGEETSAGWQPNRKLRRQRELRGWSQADVEKHLSDLAAKSGEMGPDRNSLGRWERGVRRPQPRNVRLLCQLFELPAEELGLVPQIETEQAPAGPLRVDAQTGHATSTPMLSLVPTRQVLTDPAVQAIEWLCNADVAPSAEVIDGMGSMVEHLGDQYSRTPPAVMYVRLEGLLRSLRRLMQSASPKYQTQLWSVTGWITAMLANTLYDLSDTVASEATALAAIECANRAREGRLLAFVHDRQAMRAENAGLFHAALAQFEASLVHAPPAAAVRVRAQAASARIHARLGNHDTARRALDQAEMEYGRLPARELGDGSLSVSSFLVTDVMSSTAELRGEESAAVQALEQVITYYSHLPLSRRRPTRLALAHLRMAHIKAGSTDPDEAAAYTMTALDTDRLVLPVLLQADRVSTLLYQHWPDESHVRDLRERINALVSQLPPSNVYRTTDA